MTRIRPIKHGPAHEISFRAPARFLFDRKFYFLSNKKDVDAHSRVMQMLPGGNHARRKCAPRRTLFYKITFT